MQIIHDFKKISNNPVKICNIFQQTTTIWTMNNRNNTLKSKKYKFFPSREGDGLARRRLARSRYLLASRSAAAAGPFQPAGRRRAAGRQGPAGRRSRPSLNRLEGARQRPRRLLVPALNPPPTSQSTLGTGLASSLLRCTSRADSDSRRTRTEDSPAANAPPVFLVLTDGQATVTGVV